ncbi:MAG TPA: hypothetical protein VHV55_24240 [Pirellulales bacterium]|jgi:DNA-binding GntR family transcriptional regulator|nr:hypothetical protein [Pirellulales bacterium]
MSTARPSKASVLREQLIRELDSGGYKPGDRFYTSQQAADKFGAGLALADQVLNDLVVQCRLVRRRGSGTFVADRPRRRRAPRATDPYAIELRRALREGYGAR